MSDSDTPPETPSASGASTDRDELRTMSFRMREIQRLLSVRVEQENRRLEADDIEPVENTRFVGESITDGRQTE